MARNASNVKAMPLATVPAASPAPVAAPAVRFDASKLSDYATSLWAKGYDGWDSSDSIPGVFAASLGRTLTPDERTSGVKLFRHVVYGTTDGSLRRVKGAKVSGKGAYEALGNAEGLARAFSKALTLMLDGTPIIPATPQK